MCSPLIFSAFFIKMYALQNISFKHHRLFARQTDKNSTKSIRNQENYINCTDKDSSRAIFWSSVCWNFPGGRETQNALMFMKKFVQNITFAMDIDTKHIFVFLSESDAPPNIAISTFPKTRFIEVGRTSKKSDLGTLVGGSAPSLASI